MARKKPFNLSNCWTPIAASLFIFFWASGFISAKYGLPYAEPFTFLALRFFLALTVLVPFLFFCKRHWWELDWTHGSWIHVLRLGVARLLRGLAFSTRHVQKILRIVTFTVVVYQPWVSIVLRARLTVVEGLLSRSRADRCQRRRPANSLHTLLANVHSL